ncbi:hypothetical protein BT96DRAFT_946333, partial [Gymnopus androsaceus JB14]
MSNLSPNFSPSFSPNFSSPGFMPGPTPSQSSANNAMATPGSTAGSNFSSSFSSPGFMPSPIPSQSSANTPMATPASTTGSQLTLNGFGQASPPQTPSPHSSDLTLVIDAITIDRLANDFRLNALHRANLHAFVRIGSNDPPLTKTDMATRLYTLASTYTFQEEIIRRDDARAQGNGDMQEMFQDLRIRLEDTWDVTTEQRTTIRCICQDLMYRKDRTNFCLLFVDVMTHLRREKTALRLVNIFDLPGREKRLLSVVKKIGSSVRNALRQIFVIVSLDFTFDAGLKYKRGGPGEKDDAMLTIHNSIL